MSAFIINGVSLNVPEDLIGKDIIIFNEKNEPTKYSVKITGACHAYSHAAIAYSFDNWGSCGLIPYSQIENFLKERLKTE